MSEEAQDPNNPQKKSGYSTWVIVGILAGVIAFVLAIYFIIKRKIVDHPYFYPIAITVGVIIGLIALLLFINWLLNKGKTGDKKFFWHLNNINFLLRTGHNATEIQWNRGESTRIQTRCFRVGDTVKTFMAWCGNTKDGDRQGLVYCKEDEDLWAFTGDPPKELEMNPFYGFKPEYRNVQVDMAEWAKARAAMNEKKPVQIIQNAQPNSADVVQTEGPSPNAGSKEKK